MVLQQAAFAKQQDKIAHLQKFIDRFKAKATKAKQAQSRVKALERMERLAPVLTSADFTFEFREPDQLPNPMLSIQEASFGYQSESGDKYILQAVNRSVLAGQRIGILGANGQGKSTLVKTVARSLPLLDGRVTEGKGLRIGYFAQQELDVLRPQEGPLAHMVRLAKAVSPQAHEQALRNFLGSFRFADEMVNQPVGTLSGGEKARLVLAMIVWQRPNLLLLDEPTNHLDLTTREALGMALNEFEGTVMLVSHDRALLRSVCDEFWLVGRGGVTPFDGDLDDYQRYLLEEAKRLREGLKGPAPDALPSSSQQASSDALNPKLQRKAEAQRRAELSQKTQPLRSELQSVETDMDRLNTEKLALETQLSAPMPAADIAQAGKRLKEVTGRLDALEERWLELSTLLEQLTA
jgi:ATP-binding cassette subfamily F protein 3